MEKLDYSQGVLTREFKEAEVFAERTEGQFTYLYGRYRTSRGDWRIGCWAHDGRSVGAGAQLLPKALLEQAWHLYRRDAGHLSFPAWSMLGTHIQDEYLDQAKHYLPHLKAKQPEPMPGKSEMLDAFKVMLALVRPELAKVVADVLAERQRQTDKLGWTPEHDDEHDDGCLARAAAAYAVYDGSPARPRWVIPSLWPWDAKWWKPKSRRENLVRAAALIVAELERQYRAAAREATPAEGDPLRRHRHGYPA